VITLWLKPAPCNALARKDDNKMQRTGAGCRFVSFAVYHLRVPEFW
jgi:hypothetical protein